LLRTIKFLFFDERRAARGAQLLAGQPRNARTSKHWSLRTDELQVAAV
jgi:hypothetical protein